MIISECPGQSIKLFSFESKLSNNFVGTDIKLTLSVFIKLVEIQANPDNEKKLGSYKRIKIGSHFGKPNSIINQHRSFIKSLKFNIYPSSEHINHLHRTRKGLIQTL